MCGITVWVLPQTHSSQELVAKHRPAIRNALGRRGPDSVSEVSFSVSNNGSAYVVHLWAAVLHLRGDSIVAQPMQCIKQNSLVWNGEVFGGFEPEIQPHENDTQKLFDVLNEVTSSDASPSVAEVEFAFLDVINRVEGPYSIAYFHARTNTLFFGHDHLGRRSLLWNNSLNQTLGVETDGQLALTSVGTCLEGITLEEVPCMGLYSLRIHGDSPSIQLHPWTKYNQLHRMDTVGPPETALETSGNARVSPRVHAFRDCLSEAVRRRIPAFMPPLYARDSLVEGGEDELPARVGVFFSGGLDSVVLAALATEHVPQDEPIDLISICFEKNQQSPDRLAANASFHELRRRFPHRKWRMIHVNTPYEEVISNEDYLRAVIQPCNSHMDFNIGAAFWYLSKGVGQLYELGDNDGKDSTMDSSSYTFVREQQVVRSERSVVVSVFARYAVVDSQIGGDVICPAPQCRKKIKKGCFYSLCKGCCLRIQRYGTVLLESQKDDAMRQKDSIVAERVLTKLGLECAEDKEICLRELKLRMECAKHVCNVHRSSSDAILDSKPEKPTRDSEDTSKQKSPLRYQTCARVFLIGIGADEQLGGYGRHRTSYCRGGWEALAAELNKDVDRIWRRNLGRDDRCVSDHGHEGRYPYLDEQVMAFVRSCPLSEVMNFSLPAGEGDKLLLRQVGRLLGLQDTTLRVKRAIQFGSRIAKQSNIRTFGSNRRANGNASLRTGESGELIH